MKITVSEKKVTFDLICSFIDNHDFSVPLFVYRTDAGNMDVCQIENVHGSKRYRLRWIKDGCSPGMTKIDPNGYTVKDLSETIIGGGWQLANITTMTLKDICIEP